MANEKKEQKGQDLGFEIEFSRNGSRKKLEPYLALSLFLFMSILFSFGISTDFNYAEARANLAVVPPNLGANLLNSDLNVELQWSVCENDPMSVLHKLNEKDNLDKVKSRVLIYRDQCDFKWLNKSVIWRTYTSPKKESLTLKIKSNGPELFDIDWILKNGGSCEWDKYRDSSTFSCAIKSDSDGITDEQSIFLKKTMGESVNFSDLQKFGPLKSQKWEGLTDEVLSFEAVQLTPTGLKDPSGAGYVMELSTRRPLKDRDDSYIKISQMLNARGIILCPVQAGRTRKLLESLRNCP